MEDARRRGGRYEKRKFERDYEHPPQHDLKLYHNTVVITNNDNTYSISPTGQQAHHGNQRQP